MSSSTATIVPPTKEKEKGSKGSRSSSSGGGGGGTGPTGTRRKRSISSMMTPKAKEQLEEVIQMRLSNPKQKKLIGGCYAPYFGVTCVMALCKEHIERWAKPLYLRLSADPLITTSVALLPPESYHVTLRGLESTLSPDLSVEHSLRLLDEYATVERELHGMFTEQPIQMHVGSSDRAGRFEMQSTQASIESLLRAGEELLLAELLVRCLPREGKRRQKWHLTLGYDVGDAAAVAKAQQRIGEHAKAVSASAGGKGTVKGPLTDLVFVPPHICSYRSMEKFAPLFGDDGGLLL